MLKLENDKMSLKTCNPKYIDKFFGYLILLHLMIKISRDLVKFYTWHVFDPLIFTRNASYMQYNIISKTIGAYFCNNVWKFKPIILRSRFFL